MNKLTLCIASISALLILNDFNQRFISTDQHKTTTIEIELPQALQVPLLSQASFDALQLMYGSFQSEETEQNTQPGTAIPTAEQQAAQQGRLLTVFAGDNALTLKAVINDAQQYVLIAQKNLKTGQQEVVKYANGAELSGYVISVQSNIQVELTNNNQHISLMMYKGAA
ncbi:hypothetical protein [Pseudoalteromonas ulvae]|uniref:Uncharacterized protein n=1 Tax=Pseudoalteromonas ulvae TaxID=107327 RepID=A0A244CPW3_PSEDV|nr:hypothetical protein [Pseudoalteromonas ulvae]OUL57635.1 hypothetical protein B1199_11250 [Pseudoalteromonas ulvae]